MSKSYYATKAVIRYYGPGFERRWPDPPHVAFANLQLNQQSLERFTRQYGPVSIPKGWSRAQQMVISESTEPMETALALFRLVAARDLQGAKDKQALLVKAWRGDKDAAFERGAVIDLEYDLMKQGLRPWFGITDQILRSKDAPRDALTLFADDMWTVIRIGFLMDYKLGRAKICANPDCPTPYFVESRKGQEFCEHKCAVLVNVRRFRERQAKLPAGVQHKGRPKHKR